MEASSKRKPKAATLDELFGIPANPTENLPNGLTASEVIVEMPLEWIDDFNLTFDKGKRVRQKSGFANRKEAEQQRDQVAAEFYGYT